MAKICYNSRDELVMLDLNNVACIQAESNYTHLIYMCGERMMLATGISKIEEMVAQAFISSSEPCPFIRLGRSCMINQQFLQRIDTLKQVVTLGDFQGHHLTIKVPKKMIRAYKESVQSQF